MRQSALLMCRCSIPPLFHVVKAAKYEDQSHYAVNQL